MMQHSKRKSRDDSVDDAWESYMSSGRQNITKTIPRIKPHIDGQAYLFWIVPGLNGTIKGRLFCRERAEADTIYKQTKYNCSTTFFIENRNLHNLPPKLMGSTCVIRSATSDNIDDFKLCFIHEADYEHDCLQYLEWIGPAITTEKGRSTLALFQTINRNNLASNEHLKRHFALHTRRMEEIEIVFLSKVSGWEFFADSADPSTTRMGGKYCEKKLIRDRHDGCFYANPHGPDRVSLPLRIGEKFGRTNKWALTDYFVSYQPPKGSNLAKPFGPKGCPPYWKYRRPNHPVPTFVFSSGYDLDLDPEIDEYVIGKGYVNVPILTKQLYNALPKW